MTSGQRQLLSFSLGFLICFAIVSTIRAEDLTEPSTVSRLTDRISLPKPSLDSVTAWSDELLFHQWRIQRHVHDEQCRLVDEDGDTQLKGSFDDCLARLELVKQEQELPPMRGKGVVLLHGLAAPCWSMKQLGRYLHKHGGYEVFPMDYSSLRSSVDDHARSLASVIRHLKGIESIDLVGHSMGNIVIRRYLAGDPSPHQGWRPDPRIRRIVMIAPPNNGSIAATKLADLRVYQKIFGEAGQQLGVGWEDLESRLTTPKTEFGIIAGGMRNRVGMSPFLLPGDDDGRITVETTRLPGATDFLVVPALHELIAHDPRVLRHTLQFLENGYFVSAAERQAIPPAPIAERPPNRVR